MDPTIARVAANGCRARLSIRALGRAIIAAISLMLPVVAQAAPMSAKGDAVLQNATFRLPLGADGRVLGFVDRRTGRNYLSGGDRPFAWIAKGGRVYKPSALRAERGRLIVEFGAAAVTAVFRVSSRPLYLRIEVEKVAGDGVDELAFGLAPLSLKGRPNDPFVACELALNLRTNVLYLPGPMSDLGAFCYSRFGIAGSAIAMIGVPPASLRAALKAAVADARDLPHSSLGGPRALGKRITEGSYLFNFGDLSQRTVGEWIALARSLGITQIDFNGACRHGDCAPDPRAYPNGLKSLRAVIDRLHKAGIAAGLHTYSFFIDKRSRYVTPKPDSRLASDGIFALAAPLSAAERTVSVAQSTTGISTMTSYLLQNSVTLRVDDELITYTGISKAPPYGFTGCTRGAYGTAAAQHAAGAGVYHLKEGVGLFVPDGDSTLLAEVAANTAETFNRCGFDMIYLDALDMQSIIGGKENFWYYGSRFVYELCKRLKRPALLEMSTFHHHLWCVRSRIGAWDHPNRAYKRFVDIHCKANEALSGTLLPGQLGWWALKLWTGPQGEPTYPDDIEYLMCKCLGSDMGFALMGINPPDPKSMPALPRLAAIIKRYEALRLSRRVPERVKVRLRKPGDEFTLESGPDGALRFTPVEYARHKVEGMDGWSDAWHVRNRFGRQPARLRIEALAAVASYESKDARPVVPTEPGAFAIREAAPGVTADLSPSPTDSRRCMRLTASNSGPTSRGAWARFEHVFTPPLNLSGREALGVWVLGDGKGEVLNIQLRCPPNVVAGIGDHYIPIDFKGWRCVTLVEPEAERYGDYAWPYDDIYGIYREDIDYAHIERIGLWVNNVPAGGSVTCELSEIRALPIEKARLVRPSVTLGGQIITFPVEMESGSYLEYNSSTDCKLYGPKGEILREVTPEGGAPEMAPGDNAVKFACGSPQACAARAYVTVSSRGEPFAATR